MKNYKKMYLIFALLMFSILFVVYPKTVEAANPRIVKLKTGTTYRSYDITGDKRNDTITVRTYNNSTYGYCESLKVFINGKTAYSFSNDFFYDGEYGGVEIRLYTLKNGKPFLYLYAQADNYDGPVCSVFQYKEGKLKKVIDFQTFFGEYGAHQYGDVVSVKDNTMTVKYYVMSFVVGPCYIKYNYTYENGTLKRTSNVGNFDKFYYSYGKEKKIFYANKSQTAYTSPNEKSRAFTVKKGDAVYIDKCYCNGKKMLVRVRYKGKIGWIRAAEEYPGEKNKQFSNVTYAG